MQVSSQVSGKVEESDSVERLRDDECIVFVRLIYRFFTNRCLGGLDFILCFKSWRFGIEELVGPVEECRNGNEDCERDAESNERHFETERGEVAGHREADRDGSNGVAGLRDAIGKAVVATGQCID